MEKILVASTNTLHHRRPSAFSDYIARSTQSRLLNHTLLIDNGDEVERLLKATRFSDLLIIDQYLPTIDSNTLPLKRLLTKAECPVVIAPPHFREVNEIIFAYDGSRSSVFAIKQFTYLLPELGDLKATILHVADAEAAEVAEKEEIIELLQFHYGQLGYRLIRGKIEEELCRYIQGVKSGMVVMGAFGRNQIPGYFRRSMAEPILEKLAIPLFIAHQ